MDIRQLVEESAEKQIWGRKDRGMRSEPEVIPGVFSGIHGDA